MSNQPTPFFDPSQRRLQEAPAKSKFLAAVAALALSVPALAADVDLIGVVKSQTFIQNGPDIVVLKDPMLLDEPMWLGFETFVHGSAADAVVSATVTLPGGTDTVPLVRDADEPANLAHEYGESEYLALNTARPNGTYSVQVVTKNQGTLSVGLNLTGDTYPPIPRVTNHSALQSIDPAIDATIQWPVWAGGASTDFMMMSVYDDMGAEVFRTPGPGMPGGLNGTSVSAIIPASTLQASHTYRVELLFVKVVDYLPGPPAAIAGYSKSTEFSISTVIQAGSALGAQLERAVPDNGIGNVSRNSGVTFRFTRPMTPGFLSVSWTGNGLDPSKFTYSWIDDRTLRCRYNATLPASAAIGWQLNLSGFKDAAGVSLAGQASGMFYTATDLPGNTAVTGYFFIKGRGYRQTGENPVGTNMFGCDPLLELGGYNRIRQAAIATPAGGSARLVPDEWDPSLGLEATYASKTDLDLYFPNGTQTFNVTTLPGANQAYILTTGPTDDYPEPPTITNLAALQAINPAAPVTISWTALAGWSNMRAEGISVSEIEIENDSGNETYGVDPWSMTSASGHTIPADTLWPGRTYRVTVTFSKVTDLDMTTHPGAFGAAGFSSINEFTIKTTGTAIMPAVALSRTGSGVNLNVSGGEPEREYVLETSTDFLRWLPQQALWISESGGNQYYDSDANYLPKRFYRLRDKNAEELVLSHVDIQGVVWSDGTRTTPVAGATVGTTLDGRSVTTDAAGRFFLETDTPGSFVPDSQTYSVRITVGEQTKTYGHFNGTHPRSQFYEWSTGGYGVSGP